MRKWKLPGAQSRQNSHESTGSRLRLLSMAAGALTLGAGVLALGGTQVASATGYTTGTAQSVSGTAEPQRGGLLHVGRLCRRRRQRGDLG